MADEADIAQAKSELELAAILASRLPEGPAPTGECLFCGEPVCPGRRWCGPECRDDWQRLNPGPGR